MKLPRNFTHLVAIAITLSALSSCESEDPSALGESQKALAEAAAHVVKLEDEISSLRSQLEQAKSEEPTVVTEPMKIPTLGELEASLGMHSAKLMEQARQAHPGAKIEGYQAWDLNIPSFERPFSGKVMVVAREPSGKAHELYWVAAADMEGQWTFQQVERLMPPGSARQNDAVAENRRDPREPERNSETDRNQAPTEQRQPAQRQPEQRQPDKPKYDIPLDRPIMGPGSR